MKIANQEQILDIEVRKLIIEEIKGAENLRRKSKHLRAHEILKDKTKKWVVEMLSREFSKETVLLMVNRAANVSILKKVTNKLAKAYQAGVDRSIKESQESTAKIKSMAELINANTALKKVDKYLYPHRNCLLMTVPKKNHRESTDEKPRFDINLAVYPPHLYDVIPYADNPEKAMVLVLTDFVEQIGAYSPDTTTVDGKALDNRLVLDNFDRKEQNIANSPADKGAEDRQFIFWSDRYHFTCNGKGEIIAGKSPEGLLNPIQKIPGEFFALDQDGSFWAEGGDDLVDGAILINVELTDLYTIKNFQGWGQPVLVAGDIDTEYKGGPNNLMKLKSNPGEPPPSFSYQNSNPPLDQHMRSIEMSCALYLSTNNLSPSNISGKLDATTFPSGIAQMVEDAQSTEPVEDRQRYFKDMEPSFWDTVARWQNLLFEKDSLTQAFTEIGPIKETNVMLVFPSPKPVITEKEKLENLEKRKSLGLNTMLELIKLDNPDMSEEQAKAKLAELDANVVEEPQPDPIEEEKVVEEAS
jgi:hypothetical protein